MHWFQISRFAFVLSGVVAIPQPGHAFNMSRQPTSERSQLSLPSQGGVQGRAGLTASSGRGRVRNGLIDPWSNRLNGYPITKRQRQAACPYGGSPFPGGRCVTAPPPSQLLPADNDVVEGWFADLPPANLRQIACPPGTTTSTAQYHQNIIRCVEVDSTVRR